MKPLAIRKIIFIAIGLILIITVLNFFQNPVKNLFYLISSPIQKTLWQAGKRVSDFFETIAEINNLKKENEDLKLKSQSLFAENVSLKELKKENETLRTALNLGLEKEFRLALCQVIAKDISQDSLIVDKGSDDGISKGQPVITQEKTLVGKINEVYKNFSKVQLISNKDSSFDGKIQESEIYSLVKGYGNFKVFFDLIPKDKEIKKGDIIVTAATGGIFPEGILVGEIKEVKKTDVEPLQKAEISPAFNIKEINHLFIVLDFKKP